MMIAVHDHSVRYGHALQSRQRCCYFASRCTALPCTFTDHRSRYRVFPVFTRVLAPCYWHRDAHGLTRDGGESFMLLALATRSRDRAAGRQNLIPGDCSPLGRPVLIPVPECQGGLRRSGRNSGGYAFALAPPLGSGFFCDEPPAANDCFSRCKPMSSQVVVRGDRNSVTAAEGGD